MPFYNVGFTFTTPLGPAEISSPNFPSAVIDNGGWMARLSYVEKESAAPDQEKILALVTQKSGKIANIWKLWAHSPLTLETFMPFYKTLMMKGALDSKLRELAYVKTSLINGCPYCAGPHKTSGRKVGLTDEQFQEIDNYETSLHFSQVEKAVLRYA